ncbi:MAG: cytochrome P450 [Actinomycetota bacterium]|nr:cytochrome P450 [Actinomycetota bacterium]|tara:strand:+ start:4416 stop:5591 length:1176 start_codon:yes stop_codon:yes gene_type:complete
MSSAPTVNVDPGAFWANPYPLLAEMRQSSPICFVPELRATLITRRNDIHVCEKNVAVFSSDQPEGLMNVLMGRNMMRKDAEEHRRERFIYYPAISPRKVEQVWASLFEDLTDTVLTDFAPSGSVDLVPNYATAVSGEALKAITGLTQVWFQDLDAWSQAMIDGVANYTGDPEVESRCHAATAAIDAAITERLPEVKEVPDYSLLSIMTEAGMTEDMVRANIKLTISGGQNEPRDAISGAIWALLTHPNQLALAVSGEVSWLQVFEEYCRWIAPIGMSPRRVATEHSYGGVIFEPEDRVFFMFNSANRDEEHFQAPNDFDVTRDTTASLTFGAGPHFCAGAAASRSLVGDVALPKLFERLGGLRLDSGAPPVEFGGWAFRGPLSLPVVWGDS